MAYFWTSWKHYFKEDDEASQDYRPLTYPPNEGVLGWWCTGEGDNYFTLVGMIKADTEEKAWEVVSVDWPGYEERFIESVTDLTLSDRFRLEGWAKERFAAEQQ